jgi:uncharacterized protein YdhG (YjbR/CyaY superfamily)
MLISELIKTLENIKKDKGDWNVEVKFIMPKFRSYNRPIIEFSLHDRSETLYLTAADSQETEEELKKAFSDGPKALIMIE